MPVKDDYQGYRMNIVVTGASGFIASQVITDLLAAGHAVTCCARNTAYTKSLFPEATVIACDFLRDSTAAQWLPRLANIDVVINCVGILYHPNKKIIWAVHYDTPKALFDACVTAGVKKIIQISALGVDKSTVEYAKSKKAADDYLLTLPIKAVVLRPSLVYGRGSYGGSSLFRGLAGLPFIIPVPGKGNQEFQPVHLQDLSKAVNNLVKLPISQSMVLSAVGPKRINLSTILTKMRSWLGFSHAMVVNIPLAFIRLGSRFGDLIPYSALNSTSYIMLNENNITSDAEAARFHDEIGFVPRDFISGLYSQPSTVQDHWHARLFFLKPLLQMSIAFIWLLSAAATLFFYSKTASYAMLEQIGVSTSWQPVFLYGAGIFEALIGLAMACGYQLRKICLLQIITIISYLLIITVKFPPLWLEPFAPVAFNIPLLAAILTFLALESDR
jgi:nucleoside-diphosphate-sugar epimerase